MAAPASRDFDPGRISPGETIAGGAGIALFVFLFLHWFEGASAWQAFDVVDFLLAVIALSAVAVAGAHAMGNDLLGRNAGLALTLGGTVATSIILTFVLEGDGRKIGLWLSFFAAIGVMYGGWRAMQESGASFGDLTAGTAGAGAAGAGAAATDPTAPTTPMPVTDAGVPGGGAAGVSPGKEGPGAPHPGTSTGAPGEEGGGPPPAAAAGDPVPGETAGQTPPGLAGEPSREGGTQAPGL